MNCIRLCLICCIIGIASPVWAGTNLPRTIVLSAQTMAQTKQRVLERDPTIMPAYSHLIAQADHALTAPAESVILKREPGPSNDMHDYWSLAPQWWANPDTPRGLPYIERDGEHNPEADLEQYDRMRLRRMSHDALTLALAWYLTGNEQYAGKGTALIWSWCCDSVTRTNPNMNHAHMRPGLDTGHHTGIIETADLIQVVEAARILEPSHAWTKAVSRKVKSWFSDYIEWLTQSKFGLTESTKPDHHGTWYSAQIAAFALYTENTSLARSIIGTADRRLVGIQIEPNGAMPRELNKRRSRHDTFSNLSALYALAAMGEKLDIDLWNWHAANTGSIKAALDFAAPYIAPKKSWPFGPSKAYDPSEFTPLLHRAALVYKETRYLDFLLELPTKTRLTDRAQLFH